MTSFDPHFLPVLAAMAAVLAVEAAVASALAWAALSAIDAARSSGELALCVAALAGFLLIAWRTWRLTTSDRRKD